MKRRLLILALVLLAPASSWAAGSIVVTLTHPEPAIFRYSIAWTATAGGAVSGNALTINSGYIYKAQFIPGSTTPSDLYDVVLNEPSGTVDLLNGTGANLSQTTSKMPLFSPSIPHDGGSLDLVISNAGVSTTGTVIIWVRPQP